MPVTMSRGRSFVRVAGSFLIPAAVVSAFLVPALALRPLDEDEGYYALAAKLVGHGKTPYTSFWFPQAPLMPYVYGGWQRVFDASWYVMRGHSVLLVVAVACLVYRYVVRRWRSRRLAVLAVLLVATAPIGFEWYPTVKTYALTTLLLFAAYLWAESSSARNWFVAGIFLGLAIDARLLVASVAIVFLIYARRRAGQFLIGLALGLIPAIWLFAIGPARFLNDTLRSQTSRKHATLSDNLVGKVRTVARVLVEPHFLFLAGVAALLIALCIVRRERLPLSVAIAAMLAVTNLLPTPSYPQYFVTLIPFLAIATIELVDVLGISAFVVQRRFLAIVAVILILPAAWSLHHLTASNSTRSRISDIAAISRAVDRHAERDEVVLAFWPGFVYESHVRQIPGLESDFAPAAVANSHLSAKRAADYHMLSTQEIAKAIRSHAVRLIVFGRGNANRGIRWRPIMLAAGYRPVDRVSGATLFLLAR
jgi:4-amino-4-deoxy-L-arabinose transferase-like glycosyltransferase